MRSTYLPHGGVRLHAETFGDPSAPAILLIMGAMTSGAWWPDAFCARLAAHGRHVIRYDHRDTGRSTSGVPGTTPYGVEDLADDAVAVLDGLAVPAAHLVGFSLGGYLAQLIALKHAVRVQTLTLMAAERLALADPALPGMSPDVLAYLSRAGAIDWSDRAAVVAFQVGAWRLMAGSAHPFDEAGIRALAEADFDRTPDLRTTFNHAALSDAEGWVGRMAEIRVPALVIHGTEDPVLPFAHAEALLEALPDARLLPLHGSGHDLHPADWPAIVDAIVRHTRDAGRSRASSQ